MGRTVRDVHVHGRSEAEVWNAILQWMQSHGAWVAAGPARGPHGTAVTVQMGAGIAQAKRLVEITWRPFEGGVSVHTEGYARGLGQEMDFNPSALSGGLPRREGWQAINDLWNRLGWLSSPKAIPPASPATPTVPRGPAPAASTSGQEGKRVFCTNCGTAHAATAKFCGKCGTRLGA